MSKFETFQKDKTPGNANLKSFSSIFAGFFENKRKLSEKKLRIKNIIVVCHGCRLSLNTLITLKCGEIPGNCQKCKKPAIIFWIYFIGIF